MHKGKNLRKSKEKLKYRESKKMHKKHIFLSIFSKITIFACVFCAFFVSPVFATLPAGYTELEYIESTGTQYINTGVTGSTTLGLNIDYMYTTANSPAGLIGIYQPTVPRNDTLFVTTNSGSVDASGLMLISKGKDISNKNRKTPPINEKFNAKINWLGDGEINWNNGESTNTDGSNDAVAHSIILFGREYNSAYKYTNARVYLCQISDGARIVMNFIPAKRTADNVLGMYDTVSGTFFTNSGTGDFVAGPVANCKTFGTDGVMCAACKSGYRLDSNGGCVGVIEIATTKMVDDEFAAAEAKLATTVQTIESVVSRTITQTGQIQVLQDTKQTRPDESCPANMKCLLVQDEDGTPHWYPIIEP
ncbi:MAG: hypothetical protein KBT14_00880 [Proteobacteria bacterium]|nr:hypothetical protein [Candidatus Enterousia onthequi]